MSHFEDRNMFAYWAVSRCQYWNFTDTHHWE